MKKLIDELAVFGGKPCFAEPLHVGCPNIGERQLLLRYINEILDTAYLTNRGPFVRRFENEVAQLVGVKHCIAICNGTVALELAIRALGLTGEVIVPSFTFVATAHALQWQEIAPVFCDIDAKTHHINPRCIEKMITPRTSGIIGVHLWGDPCDIDAITTIARRHRLKVLFDAAHAFGCTHGGRVIGRFGDAEVFSFHATKYVNTFEGGAIVTDNDELARKIRLMKNFGFSGYDNVVYVGTNGKMPEVCAAMGLVSLDSMGKFVRANRVNYETYRSKLNNVPGISLRCCPPGEKRNLQYIVVEVDKSGLGVDRDLLLSVLHAENVLARRYFYPGCHRMEPYRSLFPRAHLLLPNTEAVSDRVLCLPTGAAIGQETIGEICGIITLVCHNAAEVRRRLTGSFDQSDGGMLRENRRNGRRTRDCP